MGTLTPGTTTVLPDPKSYTAVPVWFGALLAHCCQAIHGVETHSIQWDCISGKALYTNLHGHAAQIQPFGVCLRPGETISVSWRPGETEYTLDIYAGDPAAARSRRVA
jgi:hypothetical protein